MKLNTISRDRADDMLHNQGFMGINHDMVQGFQNGYNSAIHDMRHEKKESKARKSREAAAKGEWRVKEVIDPAAFKQIDELIEKLNEAMARIDQIHERAKILGIRLPIEATGFITAEPLKFEPFPTFETAQIMKLTARITAIEERAIMDGDHIQTKTLPCMPFWAGKTSERVKIIKAK